MTDEVSMKKIFGFVSIEFLSLKYYCLAEYLQIYDIGRNYANFMGFFVILRHHTPRTPFKAFMANSRFSGFTLKEKLCFPFVFLLFFRNFATAMRSYCVSG